MDLNRAFQLRIRAVGGTILIDAFDDLGWDSAGRVRLRVNVRQSGREIFRGLECALHGASDGRAARELVLGMVAMRPGDTDADYFADYTPDQLAWACEHADDLSATREWRYCDANGAVRA